MHLCEATALAEHPIVTEAEMLVRIGPLIAVAALAAACSSSNKESRTAMAQGTPVHESPASGSAVDIASGTPAGTSGLTTSTNGAIEGPALRGGSTEGMASARGSSSERGSARGKVANVDPSGGSITLDRDTDPTIVVIIDENTRFVGPDGRSMSQGMAAVHEGQQVRATMDPTSHRAEEIQITRDTGP
jgi:hypothetical protein